MQPSCAVRSLSGAEEQKSVAEEQHLQLGKLILFFSHVWSIVWTSCFLFWWLERESCCHFPYNTRRKPGLAPIAYSPLKISLGAEHMCRQHQTVLLDWDLCASSSIPLLTGAKPLWTNLNSRAVLKYLTKIHPQHKHKEWGCLGGCEHCCSLSTVVVVWRGSAPVNSA